MDLKSKKCLFFFWWIFIVYMQWSTVSSETDKPGNKESLVEVRAVFLNCESDLTPDNPDSETTRFQRQEQFKHNALHDCVKKLAITVKMTAEPEAAWMQSDLSDTDPGDEYIPIDHVFEGPDSKRVRFLNPYILRLRRDPPKQAYKLHRIDTVTGVLSNVNSKKPEGKGNFIKQIREKRYADDSEADDYPLLNSAVSALSLEHDKPAHQSYSIRIGRLQELINSPNSHTLNSNGISKDCGLRLYQTSNTKKVKSQTRVAPTTTTEQTTSTNKGIKLTLQLDQDFVRGKRNVCPKLNNTSVIRIKKSYKQNLQLDEMSTRPYEDDERGQIVPKEPPHKRITGDRQTRDYGVETLERRLHINEVRPVKNAEDKSRHHELVDLNKPTSDKMESRANKEKRLSPSYDDEEKLSRKQNRNPEKDFALYEIGNPNLWYTVKVQLFEKLSSPEGKTVWNDLTRGEQASVSSVNPEWKGRDLNLRYRPTEWVPRDDFTLPLTSLCLLLPLKDTNDSSFEEDYISKDVSNEDYIVVPIEDVIGLKGAINLKKREDNSSDVNEDDPDASKERRRKVEIRVSRAIFGSAEDHFAITAVNEEKFLTLPHGRPHHGQIDLEVRADDNRLVRVGTSGRISTVVADNTRKTRTILHVQATNTGLVSARFKAVARECGPELMTLLVDKGAEEVRAGPVLLPPQHTRKLHLEIPVEVPVDTTHCNVALVNDKDESVAVREVTIKKGDRCFCVWHCDCVCLSEDPKLLCREMSQTQQIAAGLSTAGKPRRTRSCCYVDDVFINITSVIIGVLTLLLQLGLVKAILGLKFRQVGLCGLDLLLKMPRRMDAYYEPELKGRGVVYDTSGWPVHPDTCQRSVRIISAHMEFLLNLIMFVAIPGLLIIRLIIKSTGCCKSYVKGLKGGKKTTKKQAKQKQVCCSQSSSVELVLRRKRRRSLCDWMSPHAEELAADLLRSDLVLPQDLDLERTPKSRCDDDELQPLLHETSLASKSGMLSAVDSEQDDTEYVLMQMQKSRESLARSQRKVNGSAMLTDRNGSKFENIPTTSKP